MNTDVLIEIRKDLNLRQIDMAKLIGVKRSTYTNYERGTYIIPIKKLNSISNKFNYSIDYLLGITRKNDTNFKHINISNTLIRRKLKNTRINMKLTQKELAKKLKTAESTISNYENGSIIISIPVLISYSKITGKSIDYLCGKK